MSKEAGVLEDLQNPETVNLSKLLNRSLSRERPKLKLRKVRRKLKVITDPETTAKHAGLRYVLDTKPGIARRTNGSGFIYLTLQGKPLRDKKTLARIKKLAIPPAWSDVWICPIPEGHLQATGRDARNRKQYRYHPRWREVRDHTKFYRMLAFGQAIPLIRDRVDKDLALPGLPREKVLATVVRLLELTLIRIGNEEYAKDNHSYGLTTMRNRHVQIYGSEIRFLFRGKRGKVHNVGTKDRRIANILRKCQEIPGYELFQYIDESGNVMPIDSSDVNAYLREITNEDFTAKDFRTWVATVLACMALQTFGPCNSSNQSKKHVKMAVEMVARLLGNTPTICKKSYIHPALLDGYTSGSLQEALKQEAEKIAEMEGLAPEEARVLAYLRKLNATAG